MLLSSCFLNILTLSDAIFLFFILSTFNGNLFLDCLLVGASLFLAYDSLLEADPLGLPLLYPLLKEGILFLHRSLVDFKLLLRCDSTLLKCFRWRFPKGLLELLSHLT